MSAPAYYVVLDSNIWMSERLLYGPLGTALLHALAKNKAMIALPEIVQREVEHNIPEECEKQVAIAQKALGYLRQITQQGGNASIPDQTRILQSVQQRWNDLAGVTRPMAFTFRHAQAALTRIMEKTPPCGTNNEQFRDCCVWQCAIDLAAEAPVHLVTGDNAFRQGGKRDAGLAQQLADEAGKQKHPVTLHADLAELFKNLGDVETKVDEAALKKLIVESVAPLAKEYARDKDNAIVDHMKSCRIHGYTMPTANQVAIAFAADFQVSRRDEAGNAVFEGGLTLGGSCLYEPSANHISDVVIESRRSYMKGHEDGLWTARITFGSKDREGGYRLL